MTGIDWIVIGIYFVLLAGVVIGSSRQQHTSADYFLAGRNVGWFAIGGSLFASNIGSEHIVGLAGSGAMSGMAMAHWEMHADYADAGLDFRPILLPSQCIHHA